MLLKRRSLRLLPADPEIHLAHDFLGAQSGLFGTDSQPGRPRARLQVGYIFGRAGINQLLADGVHFDVNGLTHLGVGLRVLHDLVKGRYGFLLAVLHEVLGLARTHAVSVYAGLIKKAVGRCLILRRQLHDVGHWDGNVGLILSRRLNAGCEFRSRLANLVRNAGVHQVLSKREHRLVMADIVGPVGNRLTVLHLRPHGGHGCRHLLHILTQYLGGLRLLLLRVVGRVHGRCHGDDFHRSGREFAYGFKEDVGPVDLVAGRERTQCFAGATENALQAGLREVVFEVVAPHTPAGRRRCSAGHSEGFRNALHLVHPLKAACLQNAGGITHGADGVTRIKADRCRQCGHGIERAHDGSALLPLFVGLGQVIRLQRRAHGIRVLQVDSLFLHRLDQVVAEFVVVGALEHRRHLDGTGGRRQARSP